MIEKFKKRRAWKKSITQQVKSDKQQKKQQKSARKDLSKEERKIQLNQQKQESKELKQQQKLAFKSMDKKERKQVKKNKKMYRKIKNRPRKRVVGSVFGIILLVTLINYFPFIHNTYNLLSAKDVTAVTDSPEAITIREAGEKFAKQISDEGIVLIENEEENLPLQDKKVSIFGTAALNIRYGGGGSGAIDTSRAINLFDGLEGAGISYNTDLHEFYEDVAEEAGLNSSAQSGVVQVLAGMFSPTLIDEPEIDYLTEDVLKEARAFSGNALIVIAADGTEASDLKTEQLQLTQNKQDLIEKVSQHFDNITIVINAGNALDLSFVDEFPAIKSVLWMGTPGISGTSSLGEVLAGTLNPSGRLVDTYAYDVASSPASVNFGDYKYENTEKAFINYQEGIYVGYRYYETFYADNEKGYQEAVQYPFGHGLSYTTFEWEVTGQNLTEEMIELQVEVENTGDVAGKDVVQLYFSPPYIEDGIEKSAIELAAFAKTSLLEPGETETLTLSFDTREMASYDMYEEEAYVLDAGIYTIKLAENVHDVVDSVDFVLDEKIVYKEDADTGTLYENQFENANGDLTYLSRNDWEGTYPSKDATNYKASQNVLDELSKEPEASELPVPTFGADNGIQLEDLKGATYDDPKWEAFLDQFTYEELRKFVTHGAYKTIPVERLGVQQTLLMDGPAGFNYFFGRDFKAAAYPAEAVIASTWNADLAYQMGEFIGKEARTYGIQGWYAPALNIHRTSQGGRNFEYFSEDPLLNGKIGASMAKGAQDQGVIVFMKHFALNEQETNARSGILVWSNEQAIREIHLKPFEIAVKEGDVQGAMSSFSFIGPEWSGSNSALLKNVLREEWGFDGFVSSDAVFNFMNVSDAIKSGNDLMLDTLTPTANEKKLDEAYEQDPAGIANGLRNSVHNILYTVLQTYLYE